ncbi:MAG: lamin tail domain-containing protein, partial [Thermoanaerobaculia bacterium]
MGQEKSWKRASLRAAAALAALAGIGPSPLLAVVFSEINYHPPAGDERLEFIELQNELSTPEDLSGYSFTGIDFRFPPGTILAGKGIIVVCADAAAVKARYGIQNLLGNYQGRLDAGGERVALLNHAGVVMVSVRFNDRGKWPVAPDGTGHTLALRSPYLDPSEPES